MHFALTAEELNSLLSAETDEERLQILQEEIEERWDEAHLYQTDKAWDAIHRCLTDGTTNVSGGKYPLNRCILGGRHLYRSDDYIISLVTVPEVADVARALSQVSKDRMREAYFRIDPSEYGFPVSEEGFDYTWDWFDGLAAFFQRATDEGRAVIFTVDQ